MDILFLRAGIFSNLNENLYKAFRRHFNVVENVDAGRVVKRKSLHPVSWFNVAGTLIFSGQYWRQTHSKNSFAFKRMTEYCNGFVTSRNDYDVIFQTQCKFTITSNPHNRPYFIYTDLTQKLTDRAWPKWALKSSKSERARWFRLETEAFERADKIFTFNNYVKDSFINEYGLDENKIIVVGSGINGQSWTEADIEKKFNGNFTLFFLATEFERQGGPTVLKAFEQIKKRMTNIKLIVAGKSPVKPGKGIDVYKNLSREKIEKVFDETDIYLSPGALGGVQSVLEAMSKKCACIVSGSNFLLYDIVKNDSTGFTVPLNDPESLANKIVDLCNHPELASKIALQGYEHARTNFTWDIIVKKMSRYFPKQIRCMCERI